MVLLSPPSPPGPRSYGHRSRGRGLCPDPPGSKGSAPRFKVKGPGEPLEVDALLRTPLASGPPRPLTYGRRSGAKGVALGPQAGLDDGCSSLCPPPVGTYGPWSGGPRARPANLVG